MPESSGEPDRKAFGAALRILTGRDHSAAELRRKLLRRGCGEDAVAAVIAECRRLDYLNDERTARQLVRRLLRKGWGSLRVRGELIKKGLAGESLEEILSGELSAEDERLAAREALVRKMKSWPAATGHRERRLRIQRFLRSRGFQDAVIFELAGEDPPGAEEAFPERKDFDP
jgi:regulatory protein